MTYTKCSYSDYTKIMVTAVCLTFKKIINFVCHPNELVCLLTIRFFFFFLLIYNLIAKATGTLGTQIILLIFRNNPMLHLNKSLNVTNGSI